MAGLSHFLLVASLSVYSSYAAPYAPQSATAENLHIVRSRLPQRGYVPPRQMELSKRGAVPLFDNAPGGYDVEYLIDLSVGTPGAAFSCLFDTGSDILYLPYQCRTQDCQDHSEYNPSASSTSKDLGQSVQIQYGSGSASGTAYQDVVQIGNYTVQQQAFVAANQISDGGSTEDASGFGSTVQLPTDPSDCLIGISYDTIPATNTLDAPNFVKNLANEGQLSAFGMYLIRAGDVSGAASSGNSTTNLVSGSEICLGCTDTAKYTGSFSTVALANPNYGYWTAKIDGFTLNGQLIADSAAMMLFDSGTTFTAVPEATLQTIAASLGAQQSEVVTQAVGGTGYQITCSNNLKMSVGVQIGGTNFNFNDEDLVEPITNSICGLTFFGFPASDGSSTGLQGILGQTFLKAVYTQFSYANGGSIGVATLSSNAGSSGSTISNTDAGNVLSSGANSTSATSTPKSAAMSAPRMSPFLAVVAIASAICVWGMRL